MVNVDIVISFITGAIFYYLITRRKAKKVGTLIVDETTTPTCIFLELETEVGNVANKGYITLKVKTLHNPCPDSKSSNITTAEINGDTITTSTIKDKE